MNRRTPQKSLKRERPFLQLIYTVYFASILVEVPVAFSTRLTEDTGIDDSPVIFDVVDLNIEDGYDEFSGNFITNKQTRKLNFGPSL